ncbi:MAG TPA: diacylglycerol kinase family protein [Longimicrobiales bacterium]
MKRKIAVIVRPPAEAERLRALRAGVDAVRSAGARVAVRRTVGRGDARRLARSAALAGWDVVVAAGGDGTVNEVVNGLARAGTAAALAVVPLGTANDFARGLGIPEDIDEALRLAAFGRSTCVDVARVNRRCFINVSTGGFGADISQGAGRELKRYAGGLAYVVRGVRGLLEFRLRRGVFRVNGEVVHSGSYVFFAVGNARQTGGGTPVAPLADVDDGCLDVMLVRGVSRLKFIGLLPRLRRGTHLKSPDVSYYRARRFEVETDGDVVVNADGEPVAGRTFRYELLKRGQAVMVADAAPEFRSG